MATLAAYDQENAVRNISIGPSGKPLNAGVKALGAKTPGLKAPKTKQAGKANGKGNENLLLTSKKGGKLDDNAFVTPAGPRTRAPLGLKTTNAKSRAFQTPAPLGSSAKTQKVSPRLRRPKVKVHQPELDAESEDDVPEIEYMPPKEVPLPEDMDDYLPRDWNFPQIDDKDMIRGIWNAYHNPTEDGGRTRKQREFEEELARDKKKAYEDFDKVFSAQMAKDEAEARRYLGIEEPRKEALKPTSTTAAVPKRQATGASTMNARSAAAAVSPIMKHSYAAPTATAKSRAPTSLVSSRKPTQPLADRSASRQATAAAASKSTIGYAQGRAGRAAPAARKPLSNVTKSAPFSAATRRPAALVPATQRTTALKPATVRSRSAFSRSSSAATDATLVGPTQEERPYRTAEDEEHELELILLARSNDEDDDAWINSFNSQLHAEPLDEELENFQFKLPEGF